MRYRRPLYQRKQSSERENLSITSLTHSYQWNGRKKSQKSCQNHQSRHLSQRRRGKEDLMIKCQFLIHSPFQEKNNHGSCFLQYEWSPEIDNPWWTEPNSQHDHISQWNRACQYQSIWGVASPECSLSQRTGSTSPQCKGFGDSGKQSNPTPSHPHDCQFHSQFSNPRSRGDRWLWREASSRSCTMVILIWWMQQRVRHSRLLVLLETGKNSSYKSSWDWECLFIIICHHKHSSTQHGSLIPSNPSSLSSPRDREDLLLRRHEGITFHDERHVVLERTVRKRALTVLFIIEGVLSQINCLQSRQICSLSFSQP